MAIDGIAAKVANGIFSISSNYYVVSFIDSFHDYHYWMFDGYNGCHACVCTGAPAYCHHNRHGSYPFWNHLLHYDNHWYDYAAGWAGAVCGIQHIQHLTSQAVKINFAICPGGVWGNVFDGVCSATGYVASCDTGVGSPHNRIREAFSFCTSIGVP
jgi:hypothetical protein